MSSYPSNISTPSFLMSNILTQQWSDQSLMSTMHPDYHYLGNYNDSRQTDLYPGNPSCVFGTSPPPQPNHHLTYTTLSTGMSDGHQLHGDNDSGNQSSTEAPLLTPKSEAVEMVEVLEKRKLKVFLRGRCRNQISP